VSTPLGSAAKPLSHLDSTSSGDEEEFELLEDDSLPDRSEPGKFSENNDRKYEMQPIGQRVSNAYLNEKKADSKKNRVDDCRDLLDEARMKAQKSKETMLLALDDVDKLLQNIDDIGATTKKHSDGDEPESKLPSPRLIRISAKEGEKFFGFHLLTDL
ncbi:hypothetical protein PFISCL1PPCAC_8411, partial [Pristionchus fissidentatus]